MKRCLPAIVCVVIVCLVVLAVTRKEETCANMLVSNWIPITPRAEHDRMSKESADKLLQSSRAMLQNPKEKPVLLSDEEIKSLIPITKSAYKEFYDTDLTDTQAILFLGQISLHKALREDGRLKN